jgi:hypothetical protein
MRFDLTSKKIPLTAPQNLIAKLFGQQPVKQRFSHSIIIVQIVAPSVAILTEKLVH